MGFILDELLPIALSWQTGVASTVTTDTGAEPPASFATNQCQCENGVVDVWKTCEICLLSSSSTGNKTRIEAINQGTSLRSGASVTR